MTTEPDEVTVDPSEAFGEGLIFLHQNRTAIVMSPKQAGIVGRQLVDASKKSLIGRDHFLMEKVGKRILNLVKKEYRWTPLRDTPRGVSFELFVPDADGSPIGRVAKITVELDRVESE